MKKIEDLFYLFSVSWKVISITSYQQKVILGNRINRKLYR